jgi:hypothetical protein
MSLYGNGSRRCQAVDGSEENHTVTLRQAQGRSGAATQEEKKDFTT